MEIFLLFQFHSGRPIQNTIETQTGSNPTQPKSIFSLMVLREPLLVSQHCSRSLFTCFGADSEDRQWLPAMPAKLSLPQFPEPYYHVSMEGEVPHLTHVYPLIKAPPATHSD